MVINGNKIFEVVISTYNAVCYDNELAEQPDDAGLVELADGTKEKVEIAERNAFDTLQVYAINDKGESFNIIAEELS